MSRYASLPPVEGSGSLRQVRNLFFRPVTDTEFFVPYCGGEASRDCSFFTETEHLQELHFCTDDAELIDFLLHSEEVLLFGSYNQVTVCQMRAEGTVQAVDNAEAEKVRDLLRRKLRGENTDPLKFGLSAAEIAQRMKVVAGGRVFRFKVLTYAYYVYERG